MDKGNEKVNPFMEGSGNSKSENSLNLFDGKSTSYQQTQYKFSGGKNFYESSTSQKPIDLHVLNASKMSENVESKSGILGSAGNSLKLENRNVFFNKFSSDVQKNVESLPVTMSSSSEYFTNTSNISQSKEYMPIFGGNNGKSNDQQIFKSNPITTSSDPHWTPKPLFSWQKKDNKALENIFGGKAANEPSRSFKSFADLSKYSDNPKFPTPSKPVIPLHKSQEMSGNHNQPERSSTKFMGESSKSSSRMQNIPLEKKQTLNKSDEHSDIFKNINIPPKEKVSPQKESSMIIAVDIPVNYLDKSVLYNHFTKFGTVKKLLINKKTKQASIYFCDHKSASEAKAKGKRLHPLLPEMKLFFGAQPSLKKQQENIKKTLKSVSSPVSIQNTDILPKPQVKFKRNMDEKNNKENKNSQQPLQQARIEVRNKAPSGNLGSIKDLTTVMKSQSKNNYDRFLILDARDKNIRSKLKKVVDVNKAHYLSATCPDMCPEKERYSRDIQYDISVYEMTNNEVDHKLTVKKFSRSSADKDEPLPHELRPGPVLKMTMDFLCCNVVEKGDDDNVQIDLWYNYLCNRTRALRNDIMQQHLVEYNAVYVLERCIRFHIHCSHQLCEESADFFDSKINAEHLSKSLQSLRELYQDLEEKGCVFENEAEFRSYEILLSVTDGNVIFKYLKFKESIRNSSEVQFAIRVTHAIHSSNYIQFFNLLRKSTYLQACIMHKYFFSIRIKALSVIVKAYSFQLLPLPKVMRMLGFSSEDQVCEYFKYFGVVVDEGKMVINKSKFTSKPDTLPPIKKSYDMIMVKKVVSVGEIIHNEKLAENPLRFYIPHDSFDTNGYLKNEAHDASDQSVLTIDPEPDKDYKAQENLEILENESVELKKIQIQLYHKVEEMRKFKMLSTFFKSWRNYIQIQQEEKILYEKSKLFIQRKFIGLWKKKVQDSIQRERAVNNFILKRYFQSWKIYIKHSKDLKLSVERAKAIEKTILFRKFSKIWESTVKYRKLEREVVVARQYILSYKYFKKWFSITQNSLSEQRSKFLYECKLLKSSFDQWRAWISCKKYKSRINNETFPAIGSFLSTKEQNDLMNWSFDRENHLNLSADQMLENIENIEVKRRKHFALQKLSGLISWMPFPLQQTFQADVSSNPPDFSRNVFRKYFKILILSDIDTDPYLIHWVRTKFNILEIDDLSTPLHLHTQFNSPYNETTYTIFVTEHNFSPRDVPHNCDASLIILIGNEKKLHNLRSVARNCESTPYLILCKSQYTELINDDSWVMSKETIDNPYISEKLFNWILKHWKVRNQHKNVQISKLCDVLSKFIYDRVLCPALEISNQRSFFENYTLSPSQLVQYYNEAVFYSLTCMEKSESVVSNFIPEEIVLLNTELADLFKGRNTLLITSSLKKALLPALNLPSNFSHLCLRETLLKYSKEVTMNEEWGGSLLTEIRKIIENFEKALEESPILDECQLLNYIPWIDIVNSCILFKLSQLPNVNIAYTVADLNLFDSDQRFISDLRLSEISMASVCEKREGSIKRKSTPLHQFPETKKPKKTETHLLKELREEKEAALEYEQKLKAILEIEDELNVQNF